MSPLPAGAGDTLRAETTIIAIAAATREDPVMPFYLYQLTYSGDAIKAMVANPSDREAAARKLVEALGGKLHHLFFAFGTYDVVCLIEGPDDVFMMAGAASVASAGTVTASATTKLMTSAEAMAAMTKAGEVTGAYKPPHG
jgi:uncharacterized protein with GYD domain